MTDQKQASQQVPLVKALSTAAAKDGLSVLHLATVTLPFPVQTLFFDKAGVVAFEAKPGNPHRATMHVSCNNGAKLDERTALALYESLEPTRNKLLKEPGSLDIPFPEGSPISHACTKAQSKAAKVTKGI